MRSLINFFGRRQFNLLDVVGLLLFSELWGEKEYVLAVALMVVVLLASVAIERRVG